MHEVATTDPRGESKDPGVSRNLTMHGKAASDLAYIRRAMDGSMRFTAVSGWGGVAMAATAFAAAPLAAACTSSAGWLLVWLTAAGAGLTVGVGAVVVKAKRTGQSLAAGAGRRFIFGLGPPLLLGALLTIALWDAGQAVLLPPMWLLVYGTALTTAGACTIAAIPAMGGAFVILGVAALLAGPTWGDCFMATGFGGVNLAGGLVVLRKHGG